MELNELSIGMTVLIPVKVMHILGKEGQPREAQVIIVQLSDGQGIHTNIGNLRAPDFELDIPEPEPVEDLSEDLLAIPHLPPKAVRILMDEGIHTQEDLKYVPNLFLADLPTFGARHLAAIRNVVPYVGPRPAEPEKQSEPEPEAEQVEVPETPQEELPELKIPEETPAEVPVEEPTKTKKEK